MNFGNDNGINKNTGLTRLEELMLLFCQTEKNEARNRRICNTFNMMQEKFFQGDIQSAFDFMKNRVLCELNLKNFNKELESSIRDVYVNEDKKTVVVKYNDGSIEKSVCTEGDTFSVEAGLAIAHFKHEQGFASNTSYRKYIDDIKKKNELNARKKSLKCKLKKSETKKKTKKNTEEKPEE